MKAALYRKLLHFCNLIAANYFVFLCPYIAFCLYLFAEDRNGAVTTFRAGSTVNVTFHLAYPHRVSTILATDNQ